MDRIFPFGACRSEVRRRIQATQHESTARTSEVCSENCWCRRLVLGSKRRRNLLPAWLGFRDLGRRICHHARIRFFGMKARFGLNLKEAHTDEEEEATRPSPRQTEGRIPK